MANEMTIAKPEQFALLGPDSSELMAVMQENLGDLELGFSDLERIKLPSGGALAWEIDGDYVKAFSAIILHMAQTRAVFEKSFDEDPNEKPVCTSHDGHTGRIQAGGTSVGGAYPTGDCSSCPLAQWNDDNPPACQESMLLVVLRSDSMLPSILRAPRTSIKPMKQYLTKLTMKGIGRTGVVTEFLLQEDKNEAGIKFARIAPRTDGTAILSKEQKATIKQVVEQYSGLIQRAVESEAAQAGEKVVSESEAGVYDE